MNYTKNDLKFPYYLTIKSYDTSNDNFMRLNCILKHQQQAGEEQLEFFGYGHELMFEDGLVWIVTNTSVKINRMPTYNEKLRLDTWSRDIKGAKFYRSYNWYSEDGELLIEGTTLFLLVDTVRHKPKHPSAVSLEMPGDFNEMNSAPEPKRIFLPDDSLFETVGERQIYYSLLDQNGHLNNAFYSDFLTDFAPDMNNPIPKEFAIDFVGEAKLNETVRIRRAEVEGIYYFCGEHDRGMCFRAKCRY